MAKQLAERLPLSPLRSMLQTVLRTRSASLLQHDLLFSPPFAFLTHGQGIQMVTLRNGRKIIVDTQEHVGLVLMWTGDLDPALTELTRLILRPGDRVIDVGANIGWFSITAADMVGREGAVHSFEPQPHLCTMFEASLLANHFEQVQLHRFGLSREPSTRELYVSRGNAGLASLYPERVPNPMKVRVELRDLKSLPARFSGGGFRLLKIDVEGHEISVLETLEPLFAVSSIPAVLFESNLDARPFSQRETPRWLQAHGYQLFGVEARRHGVWLNADVDESELNDFLAWHPSAPMPAELLGRIKHADHVAARGFGLRGRRSR